MKKVLLITGILFAVIAHGQYANGDTTNSNPTLYTYATMAEAVSTPKKVGYKFDVIENGVISHFTTLERSDGYLKPDSILVIALKDSSTIIVRESQTLQIEFFKLPVENDWYYAFQRWARFVNLRGGNCFTRFNPKEYPIDTMKVGYAIYDTIITYHDTIPVEDGDTTLTGDTIIYANPDTLIKVSTHVRLNTIANIDFLFDSNITIDGNGAKISVRGDFRRIWTHTNTSGHLHASDINSICPLEFRVCKNIRIYNLEIYGNVDKMTKDTLVSEGDDYGMEIRGCDGVHVSDVYVHGFATDGFNIEGGFHSSTNTLPPYAPTQNLIFDRVKSWYNGRQGASIGALYQAQFNNCSFSHTNDNSEGMMGTYPGHSPSKGIDIEPIFQFPARIDKMTSEVEFNNCDFVANKGGAFASALAKIVKNVRISGGTINSYPYEPNFLITIGIQNFVCDNADITFTKNTKLYLNYGYSAGKKLTWTNNTFITGGTITMSNPAEYGVLFDHNLVIGRHDTAYQGHFPYFTTNMICTNNIFVLDSNLYSATAVHTGLMQAMLLSYNNKFISQMEDSVAPMYTMSYVNTKTVLNERYLPGQAVRPLSADTFNTTSTYGFSTGEVQLGSKQVVYLGRGRVLHVYYANDYPITGLYERGDIIVMNNPDDAGFDHLRCTVAGDAALGTAVFEPVGEIGKAKVTFAGGLTTDVNNKVSLGDSSGLYGETPRKLARTGFIKGSFYTTPGRADTGMIVFESPTGFTSGLDVRLKGNILRGGKTAQFDITFQPTSIHTFINAGMTISGDSSLQAIKVRLLKDTGTANGYYIAFFDSTTTLPDKSGISVEYVSIAGNTASLESASKTWLPVLATSMDAYVIKNTLGNGNSADYNTLINKPLEYITYQTGSYTLNTANGTTQNIVFDLSAGAALTLPTPASATVVYVSNSSANALTFSQTVYNTDSDTYTSLTNGTIKLVWNVTKSKWYKL